MSGVRIRIGSVQVEKWKYSITVVLPKLRHDTGPKNWCSLGKLGQFWKMWFKVQDIMFVAQKKFLQKNNKWDCLSPSNRSECYQERFEWFKQTLILSYFFKPYPNCITIQARKTDAVWVRWCSLGKDTVFKSMNGYTNRPFVLGNRPTYELNLYESDLKITNYFGNGYSFDFHSIPKSENPPDIGYMI